MTIPPPPGDYRDICWEHLDSAFQVLLREMDEGGSFDRISRAMAAVDWQWRDRCPTAAEVRNSLESLYRDIRSSVQKGVESGEYREWKDPPYMTQCGGWEVYLYPEGFVEVKFDFLNGASIAGPGPMQVGYLVGDGYDNYDDYVAEKGPREERDPGRRNLLLE